MPEHDDQSQSTLNSATAATAEASHFVEVTIDSRASACNKLVENAVEKDIPATLLADSLKGIGLKAIEAVDYIDEFNQQVAIRCSKAKQPDSSPHELAAEGSVHAVDQQEHDKAVEEAAWPYFNPGLSLQCLCLPWTPPPTSLTRCSNSWGKTLHLQPLF